MMMGSVVKIDCEDCSLGFVSINEGSDACTLCGLGSYFDIVLGSGIFVESCKFCLVGLYFVVEGVMSVLVCILCVVGTYNFADG